jgi:hypothetical protein
VTSQLNTSLNASRLSFETSTSRKNISKWQSLGGDNKDREILLNLDNDRRYYARRSDDKRHPLARHRSTSPLSSTRPPPHDYGLSAGKTSKPPLGRRRRAMSPVSLSSDFDSRGSSPRSSQRSRDESIRVPSIVEEIQEIRVEAGCKSTSLVYAHPLDEMSPLPSQSQTPLQGSLFLQGDIGREAVRLPASEDTLEHDRRIRDPSSRDASRDSDQRSEASARGISTPTNVRYDDPPRGEQGQDPENDGRTDQHKEPEIWRRAGDSYPSKDTPNRRTRSSETRRSARTQGHRSGNDEKYKARDTIVVSLGDDIEVDYDERRAIVMSHGDGIEVQYDQEVEIVVTEPTPKKRKGSNRPRKGGSRNPSTSTQNRTDKIRDPGPGTPRHGWSDAKTRSAVPPDYYDPRLAVDGYTNDRGSVTRNKPSAHSSESLPSQEGGDIRPRSANAGESPSTVRDCVDRSPRFGRQDRSGGRPSGSRVRSSDFTMPALSEHGSISGHRRPLPFAAMAFSPPPSVAARRDDSELGSRQDREAKGHRSDHGLSVGEEPGRGQDYLNRDISASFDNPRESTSATGSRQARRTDQDQIFPARQLPSGTHLKIPVRGPRGLSQASSQRDLRYRSPAPLRPPIPVPPHRTRSRSSSSDHGDDRSSSGELLYDSGQYPGPVHREEVSRS